MSAIPPGHDVPEMIAVTEARDGAASRSFRAGPWLVAAAALIVHSDNLERALLGWDTHATLLAARITSFSDFVGTFSESLMDGRLLFGDFYRPVGNLFVALDVAIWGIDLSAIN